MAIYFLPSGLLALRSPYLLLSFPPSLYSSHSGLLCVLPTLHLASHLGRGDLASSSCRMSECHTTSNFFYSALIEDITISLQCSFTDHPIEISPSLCFLCFISLIIIDNYCCSVNKLCLTLLTDCSMQGFLSSTVSGAAQTHVH